MMLHHHLVDRDPMRLALTLLLVVATVGFASAQGTGQGTPQGTSKKAPQAATKPASQVAPQVTPQVTPKETPNEKDEMLRQRLLLKERFNKSWDVQIENAQDQTHLASRCKAEARRRFSVLHPLKRRRFVRDCVERKGR
jgi:hypothetical protein